MKKPHRNCGLFTITYGQLPMRMKGAQNIGMGEGSLWLGDLARRGALRAGLVYRRTALENST